MDFFPLPEQNKKVMAWIHAHYARRVGLMEHEYNVNINPNLVDFKGRPLDLALYAGPRIEIFIRATPLEPQEFKLSLKHAFLMNHRIRDLIRTVAVVKRSDAAKLYGIERNFIGMKEPKVKDYKPTHIETKVYKLVVVKDKKTGVTQTVILNSDVFNAQELAIKMLYHT